MSDPSLAPSSHVSPEGATEPLDAIQNASARADDQPSDEDDEEEEDADEEDEDEYDEEAIDAMLVYDEEADPTVSKDEALDPELDVEALGLDDLDSDDDEDDLEDDDSEEAELEDELAEDDEDDSEEDEDDDEDPSDVASWLDRDTVAFLTSMALHVFVVVALGSITIVTQPDLLSALIRSEPIAEELEPLDVINDIAYSDTPSDEIGTDSIGDMGMALSSAPVLADLSTVETVDLDIAMPNGSMEISKDVQVAMGLTEAPKAVRGMTGVGATGTDGAVDRVTYELLQSIEERPTLVVWIFDSSISMVKRRQEIRDRFDRIYEQLGIVQDEKAKRDGQPEIPPLLTAVMSFGSEVQVLTKQPTDDLQTIRSSIDAIGNEGGDEMVFHAVKTAVERFKSYRTARNSNSPERNVMLIVVTDERGDDLPMAEETIKVCRFHAMPCYVLGVPSPFGRDKAYIKFVEFDPKYAQGEEWAEVDQGPETLYPERVKLGYQDEYMAEPVIDSGFGPYALSKLCYETGGIYFTIHPNRRFNGRVERRETEAFASQMSYFFHPDVMERYRPDYLSEKEYMTRAKKSPLRMAVLNAAQLSRAGTLSKPKMLFIKRDEATFTRELTDAQLESARLYPELSEMCNVLSEGEKFRSKETSPRWLASYELSYGTALAAKIRAESYNAMLAKGKRGMNFEKPENNTWNLRPSDRVNVDSKLEKEAKFARELLQSVVEKHAGTPWALLASRELDHPMGWEWSESFTDLNPPARPNNTPPPPATQPMPEDEKARMLKPPPPKRPITKI
ncbi:MAG: vWA domain-containing protein [Pirellula sp.]